MNRESNRDKPQEDPGNIPRTIFDNTIHILWLIPHHEILIHLDLFDMWI